ncbi:MAG TPA: L,D-transpeptidase, partial [Paenirhodobacter sp.]
MKRRTLMTAFAALACGGMPALSRAAVATTPDPVEVAPKAQTWPIAQRYYPTEVTVKPDLAV